MCKTRINTGYTRKTTVTVHHNFLGWHLRSSGNKKPRHFVPGFRYMYLQQSLLNHYFYSLFVLAIGQVYSVNTFAQLLCADEVIYFS